MGVLGVNHLAFRTSDPPAFDVDAAGFEEALQRAKRLRAFERGPVAFTDASRAFFARDPDGRRLEFTQNDPGVFWR